MAAILCLTYLLNQDREDDEEDDEEEIHMHQNESLSEP